jgi:hypothetical protein
MNMELRKFGIIFILSVAAGLSPDQTALAINPGTPWPAMDGLSRSLPDPAEIPPPRADRFVGIFYFLWHDRDTSTLPNDLSKILPQDPDILSRLMCRSLRTSTR